MVMPAGAIVLLISGISLAVAVVAVAAGLRLRRRMFAGPAWDRWQDARAGLSSRDQRRVRLATMRHRPISTPELVAAQLAYLGYARDTATRSPMLTKRWLRAVFPVLYALLGISELITAMQHRPGPARIFDFVLAGAFAVLAVMWAVVVPRSLARQSGRLDRLHDRITDPTG